MSRNWTANQQLAIDARRGSLLVSAAAGSGKTAVLVERVIKTVTDAENPVPIDKLLIVTFTVAAAKELKDRISNTLSKLISENPDNGWYRRQLVHLPYANISTVDSYCSSVVREFSQVIGITNDFKIGESGELKLLVAEALEETLEHMYSQKSSDFSELIETYAVSKKDNKIEEHIVKLYEFLRSHPNSDAWLDEKLSYYKNITDLSNSIWGKIVREYAISAVYYCKDLISSAIKTAQQDPDIYSTAIKYLSEDTQYYDSVIDAMKKCSWDDIRSVLFSYKPRDYRFPRDIPKDHPIKEKSGNLRKLARKKLTDILTLFSKDEKECIDEFNRLSPIVEKLFECVKVFSEVYSRKKAEKNLADFSDLSHGMLKLLVEYDEEGKPQLTRYADLLSERFHEVMVDEYQDANEVQDLIYYALSRKGTNLFAVGDVKQSIYGFRQAMPEIFLSRKNTLPLYERDKDNYPSKVILKKNFRSRREVTDFINYTFSMLMSVETGDMVYDEEEALYPEAKYSPATTPCCELHLLDMDEVEDVDNAVAEARYIASMILRMCKDTFIQDNGKERRLNFADVAVIMRKKEGFAKIYAEELKKMGVPASSDETFEFLSAREITLVMNLLRVIDNPMQDIPLTSVLMSPLFGFTPDDMARIRIADKYANIYLALKTSSRIGDKKSKAFLRWLELFRNIAVTEPCDLFLCRLYDELHIPAIASAAWGKGSVANLRLLVDYAKKYEQNSSKGVSQFVNYINRLEQQRTDLPASQDSGSSDLNVVRVMSIHSSKGLEFPVCIVANMGRNFSSNSRKSVHIHPKIGFASKLRNHELSCNHTTFARESMLLALDRSDKSEELRVLYVAMTRAKERLIMVASHPGLQNKVKATAQKFAGGTEITPFMVRDCKQLSEWPIMCALLHPNGGELRRYAEMDEPEKFFCPNTLNFKTVIVTSLDSEDVPLKTEDAELTSSVSFEQLPSDAESIIHSRFNYQYPYIGLSKIPQKVTASELSHSKSIKPLQRVLPAPDFIKEKKVTGAMRGTAMHTYLEHCDFSRARKSISDDIERVRSEGYLTDEQIALLDVEKLSVFINGNIVTQALSAEKVLREYRFTVNIPAKLAFDDINDDLKDVPIVLQGAVDLLLVCSDGITIVDYKTDRVKDADELVKIYDKQLKLYKEAVSQIFSLPVKKCLIYSIHLCEIKEVIV